MSALLSSMALLTFVSATPPAQQPHAVPHGKAKSSATQSTPAHSQPGSPSPAGAPESSVPPLAMSPKFLERADPSLEQGARLLATGDVDGAIEKFHKAEPKDADERAIVEYDVGSAQLDRAAASAEKTQPTSPGAAANAPQEKQPKIDKSALDDAKASFDRAFGLAKDPRIKSEAALAAGNAAARANDVDDAIAQYRKAVVADPTNARAKTNLRRVLDAKRAQPPPPPQKNSDNNDDKKKNDDKKDQKDGDRNDQKKSGDDKKQDQKKDGDDKKDQKQEQSDKKDQPSPQDQSPEAQKQRKKEAAKRLLDAMRARERPLTPLEMRGQEQQQRAKDGKDW